MDGNVVTVEKTLHAPTEAIFALLSDAAKHSSFDGSGSVVGLRDYGEPLVLGSVFSMSMKRGVGYATRNEVVEFEPGRLIAWRTTALKGLIGGRIWRYELTPTADGTMVRESWDISGDKQRFLLRRGSMPTATRKAMERTLGRLQRAAQDHAERAA